MEGQGNREDKEGTKIISVSIFLAGVGPNE